MFPRALRLAILGRLDHLLPPLHLSSCPSSFCLLVPTALSFAVLPLSSAPTLQGSQGKGRPRTRTAMRRLRIGILDLVTKSPNPSLYGRVMNANLASIMPQVLGVWCEQEGHQVQVVCYTGMEDLLEELPSAVDLVFIGAFSQSAQLAYALSNFFQQRGAVTVLGGPHARCYPEDASKYYD